jgi:hypothetical protein
LATRAQTRATGQRGSETRKRRAAASRPWGNRGPPGQDARLRDVRAPEDDRLLGDRASGEETRAGLHDRTRRGGGLLAPVRRPVGRDRVEKDEGGRKGERHVVRVDRPVRRRGLPGEFLLPDGAGEKPPESGRSSVHDAGDDRPPLFIHLAEELRSGGLGPDIAPEDEGLAVEPVLKPAQDVARRLAVVAEDVLEGDAPPDPLAEPLLDLPGSRANDEERVADPGGDEGGQHPLEDGDALDRKESGDDPRAERPEGRSVAVGEDDGRHPEAIINDGRRPGGPSSAPPGRSPRP